MCLAWQIRLQRQAAGNQPAAVCSCCRLAHAFLPPQLLTHAVPALPPLPCPALPAARVASGVRCLACCCGTRSSSRCPMCFGRLSRRRRWTSTLQASTPPARSVDPVALPTLRAVPPWHPSASPDPPEPPPIHCGCRKRWRRAWPWWRPAARPRCSARPGRRTWVRWHVALAGIDSPWRTCSSWRSALAGGHWRRCAACWPGTTPGGAVRGMVG